VEASPQQQRRQQRCGEQWHSNGSGKGILAMTAWHSPIAASLAFFLLSFYILLHSREKDDVSRLSDTIKLQRYNHQGKLLHKECVTTALVDSGASENFIDKAYAEAHGIPMQQKATPRQVMTVDGSEVTGGPVIHDAQIHLTINHHEEDIQLHCITIGNAPIILGLPWLKLHDPVIGWKNHTVKFHSDYCAEKCLPSSPRANTVPEEKATEQYYEKMPAENWEIGKTDQWEVC